MVRRDEEYVALTPSIHKPIAPVLAVAARAATVAGMTSGEWLCRENKARVAASQVRLRSSAHGVRVRNLGTLDNRRRWPRHGRAIMGRRMLVLVGILVLLVTLSGAAGADVAGQPPIAHLPLYIALGDCIDSLPP